MRPRLYASDLALRITDSVRYGGLMNHWPSKGEPQKFKRGSNHEITKKATFRSPVSHL